MKPSEVEDAISQQLAEAVRVAEILGAYQVALVQGLVRVGRALDEATAGLAEADGAATFVVEEPSRNKVLNVLALMQQRFPALVARIESIRQKVAAHSAEDATRRAIEGGEA